LDWPKNKKEGIWDSSIFLTDPQSDSSLDVPGRSFPPFDMPACGGVTAPSFPPSKVIVVITLQYLHQLSQTPLLIMCQSNSSHLHTLWDVLPYPPDLLEVTAQLLVHLRSDFFLRIPIPEEYCRRQPTSAFSLFPREKCVDSPPTPLISVGIPVLLRAPKDGRTAHEYLFRLQRSSCCLRYSSRRSFSSPSIASFPSEASSLHSGHCPSFPNSHLLFLVVLRLYFFFHFFSMSFVDVTETMYLNCLVVPLLVSFQMHQICIRIPLLSSGLCPPPFLGGFSPSQICSCSPPIL